MVCVICLDEESPAQQVPCKTCFGVEFHETCLQEYKRTKEVCPTCKTPFFEESHAQQPPPPEEELVVHCSCRSDVYRTSVVFQFFLICFTLAFVPHGHKLTLAGLFATLLALVLAHVFERVDTWMMTFRMLGGMAWSLTASNTVIYDHSVLMIVYVTLSCVNLFVYVLFKGSSASVQPE
jgi:hypothetical protein